MNALQTWNPKLYEQSHAFVWQLSADLIQLLNPQAGERILDLGCGTGQLTAQIAAAGAAVCGIDNSAEMIDKARANYPDLSFVRADARSFQAEQSAGQLYDAVFSNAMLHWILEPDAVIRPIYKALKPGGRFVAEFGGKGNVSAIITALDALLDQALGATEGATEEATETQWYFPSIGDYTTRLEQQGLEVTYAVLFDRPTELAGEAGLANWLEMFAGVRLNLLSPNQRVEVIDQIETQLRPLLCQNGTWLADYRRMRVVAYRR
jgi:trans-aconitate methyltransferase